ncbi:MAG: O-antigen ligase family protein [Hyphomonadaceae bacterium]
MILLAYLPEIAGVLLFALMATQVAEIGPYLILVDLALVGMLFVFRTRTFLETLARWWPVLLAPALALASTAWSEAPMTSLRYGAQFLFTCLIGVVLARLMTPKRFVCAFLVSMFIFCLACLAYGRQGASAEGMVLIGLTGSKNQMGFAAQLLIMSGLAVLMMRDIHAALRWLAVLALPLGVALLLGANSATALLMAAGGSAALVGLWFAQRLPPGGRLATLVGGLLILSPLALLAPEINAFINHFVFDTLDKDPTLTGRTFLWQRADDLIAQRPLLGYGYQAIWMGDSTETIALQRLTGMTDGRVFHFHHQFRQVAVDTGLAGLLAFVGMVLAVGFAALRQTLLYPSVATSFFFVIFMLMIARAFTDTILQPFNMHTLLFFAACTYAFWRPQAAAIGAQQAQPTFRPAGHVRA